MRFLNVLERRLAEIDAAAQRRDLLPLERAVGPRVRIGGREYVNLCSNDYLNLAADARLVESAHRAALAHGAGAGASRLVTGNPPCHAELEEAVASFLGYESALLFGSGYHANMGLIPSLAREGDLVLSDELNHASLIDGCRLSRAKRLVYRHSDLIHLEAMLREHRGGANLALVLTETVFSMDGDAPDLPALADLCRRHDAALVVDEAHALGVVGDGRGFVASLQLQDRVDAVVGTFGKSFGAFGAFVAGSARLREWLVNSARSVIFSTALPPPVVGAALEGLRIVREEGAALVGALHRRSRQIADIARSTGFSVPDPAGAIIPAIVGGEREALDAARILFDHGVLARAIRPPTVPLGTSRLRLTASAGHSDDDLEIVRQAFRNLM